MAEFKSTQIANATADPYITNSAGQMYGRARIHQDSTVFGVGFAATDTLRAARLPSNARVTEVDILTAVASGPLGTTFDVGLGEADGTVIDVDLFATATSGQNVFGAVNLRFDNLSVDTIGQMLWELLGLTEDPNVEYEVTCTVVDATGAAAGNVGVGVQWTVAS